MGCAAKLMPTKSWFEKRGSSICSAFLVARVLMLQYSFLCRLYFESSVQGSRPDRNGPYGCRVRLPMPRKTSLQRPTRSSRSSTLSEKSGLFPAKSWLVLRIFQEGPFGPEGAPPKISQNKPGFSGSNLDFLRLSARRSSHVLAFSHVIRVLPRARGAVCVFRRPEDVSCVRRRPGRGTLQES